MSHFRIKTNLLNLEGAFLTNIKGRQSTKRCLCIPVNDAKLFLGQKGVYLDLVAFERREPTGDDTHLLKQSFSKAQQDAMTEEQRSKLPILGSMGELKTQVVAVEGEVTAELDDLPF